MLDFLQRIKKICRKKFSSSEIRLLNLIDVKRLRYAAGYTYIRIDALISWLQDSVLQKHVGCYPHQ